VLECQSVLFYEVAEDVLVRRCAERAKTSGRSDDNEETLLKRFRAFNEQTKPVVDLYEKFGKVRRIDASGDIPEVFELTKLALLPQVSFMLGPKCSGKTTLGKALAEKTNMKLINFGQFLKAKGVKGSDEDQTMALIKHLQEEVSPRILLEDFPQNDTQAKFFVKNCKAPEQVFCLACSKDTCQERMLELGREHPNYLPSSLLSKRIQQFHQSMTTVAPYLKQVSRFHEVNSELSFDNTFQELTALVAPVIVHVRAGNSSNELRKEIVQRL